ncbi:hypothetical protein MMPV_003848 [Pyropia vietnamensis]
MVACGGGGGGGGAPPRGSLPLPPRSAGSATTGSASGGSASSGGGAMVAGVEGGVAAGLGGGARRRRPSLAVVKQDLVVGGSGNGSEPPPLGGSAPPRALPTRAAATAKWSRASHPASGGSLPPVSPPQLSGAPPPPPPTCTPLSDDADADRRVRETFCAFYPRRLNFDKKRPVDVATLSPFAAAAAAIDGVSADDACAVCGGDGDSSPLVACSRCPLAFHADCCEPPLATRPAAGAAWRCRGCASLRRSRNYDAVGLARATRDAREGNPLALVLPASLHAGYVAARAGGCDWLRCARCGTIRSVRPGVLSEAMPSSWACADAFWVPGAATVGCRRPPEAAVANVAAHLARRASERRRLFEVDFGAENPELWASPAVVQGRLGRPRTAPSPRSSGGMEGGGNRGGRLPHGAGGGGAAPPPPSPLPLVGRGGVTPAPFFGYRGSGGGGGLGQARVRPSPLPPPPTAAEVTATVVEAAAMAVDSAATEDEDDDDEVLHLRHAICSRVAGVGPPHQGRGVAGSGRDGDDVLLRRGLADGIPQPPVAHYRDHDGDGSHQAIHALADVSPSQVRAVTGVGERAYDRLSGDHAAGPLLSPYGEAWGGHQALPLDKAPYGEHGPPLNEGIQQAPLVRSRGTYEQLGTPRLRPNAAAQLRAVPPHRLGPQPPQQHTPVVFDVDGRRRRAYNDPYGPDGAHPPATYRNPSFDGLGHDPPGATGGAVARGHVPPHRQGYLLPSSSQDGYSVSLRPPPSPLAKRPRVHTPGASLAAGGEPFRPLPFVHGATTAVVAAVAGAGYSPLAPPAHHGDSPHIPSGSRSIGRGDHGGSVTAAAATSPSVVARRSYRLARVKVEPVGAYGGRGTPALAYSAAPTALPGGDHFLARSTPRLVPDAHGVLVQRPMGCPHHGDDVGTPPPPSPPLPAPPPLPPFSPSHAPDLSRLSDAAAAAAVLELVGRQSAVPVELEDEVVSLALARDADCLMLMRAFGADPPRFFRHVSNLLVRRSAAAAAPAAAGVGVGVGVNGGTFTDTNEGVDKGVGTAAVAGAGADAAVDVNAGAGLGTGIGAGAGISTGAGDSTGAFAGDATALVNPSTGTVAGEATAATAVALPPSSSHNAADEPSARAVVRGVSPSPVVGAPGDRGGSVGGGGGGRGGDDSNVGGDGGDRDGGSGGGDAGCGGDGGGDDRDDGGDHGCGDGDGNRSSGGDAKRRCMNAPPASNGGGSSASPDDGGDAGSGSGAGGGCAERLPDKGRAVPSVQAAVEASPPLRGLH